VCEKWRKKVLQVQWDQSEEMKMVTQERSQNATKAVGSPVRKTRRPDGYRWLSLPLPQHIFNKLHIQARLSDMSFQTYMVRFCDEAFPYDEKTVSPQKKPEQAPSLD
jgi:hypothetical protein